MLQSTDLFLLKRVYTPFAHWYMRQTGNSNLRLVYWCLGLSFLSLATRIGVRLTLLKDFDAFDYIVQPVALFASVVFILAIARAEEASKKNQRLTMSIAVFVRNWWLRKAILIAAMLNVVVLTVEYAVTETPFSWLEPDTIRDALLTLDIFFLGSALYFLAVEPPTVERDPQGVFARVRVV
jgi:cytochrome c oxidase assembly factor CtaG